MPQWFGPYKDSCNDISRDNIPKEFLFSLMHFAQTSPTSLSCPK